MTPRLNPFTAAPAPMAKWLEFGQTVLQGGLEQNLMELVKIRASQINGCAACLHMHAAAARKAGETEDRILLLSAWRDTALYTPRERAALAWTEALTLLPDTHAPDEAYDMVRTEFNEQQQVLLSLLIVTINGWNRLQVGFRVGPQYEAKAA